MSGMQRQFETEETLAQRGYTPEESRELVRRAQRIRAEREERLSAEALASSAAEVGIAEEDLLEAERQLREERLQRQRQQALRRAVAAATAAILALFLLFSYNTLNATRLAAQEARANLQAALQRRADLARQLLPLVREGSAAERRTLVEAQQALRSSDPAAQAAGASQVLALARTSPQVQSTELYRTLQVQIEGSENRVAVARQRYNRAVAEYNRTAQGFPVRLVRPLFGFPAELKPFDAAPEAERVPEVR